MSKNSKTVLKYPQYQEIIHNYLNVDEFNTKVNVTIRGQLEEMAMRYLIRKLKENDKIVINRNTI